MAVPLNTHQVCGVFALGQWFKVKPGTFSIDAYFLRQWRADPGIEKVGWKVPFTDYEMGALYHQSQPEFCSTSYGGDSLGRWITPSGLDACCFIDPESGKRVTFSLMEVRAFREDPGSPA